MLCHHIESVGRATFTSKGTYSTSMQESKGLAAAQTLRRRLRSSRSDCRRSRKGDEGRLRLPAEPAVPGRLPRLPSRARCASSCQPASPPQPLLLGLRI